MIAYLIPASCNGLMKMMKDDRDLAKRWMTCSISGCDERDYRSCNKDATKYPIVALLHPFHQHVLMLPFPLIMLLDPYALSHAGFSCL